MPRIRAIKPGFFTNELMGTLDPLARLLFIGLWTLADCEGRLEERPKRIQAQVLPYDECDVDRFLEELEELGFLLRYEARGRRVIQIVNFTKHQHPHFKEAAYDLPPPPALGKPEASPRQTQGKPEAGPGRSREREHAVNAENVELQENPRQALGKPEASRVVNGELLMGNGERETRARAKPVAKDATRVSLLSLSINEDFLSDLQKKYPAIEVRHVHAKMAAWCETSGKSPTRERLVSWCANEEPRPRAGSIKPAGTKPFDPGRSAPESAKPRPVDVDQIIALADELEALGLKEQAQAVRQGLKPQ